MYLDKNLDSPKSQTVNLSAVDLVKTLDFARSPKTSPAELAKLAEQNNRELHKAIARNPNTPENILQSLWELWPEAILENPIVDIWELTQSIPLHKKLSLDALWHWYHYFITTKQYAKINAYIPENIRYHYPNGFKTLEYWLTEDPSSDVRSKVARTTRKPEVQAILARDKDDSVRISLASNYHLSPYCHRILATDKLESVQFETANNINVIDEYDSGYGILVSSDFRSVRLATAANPKVGYEYLSKYLVKDECHKVRVQAAKHEYIGIDLHRKLQKTNDVPILQALAANRIVDISFLERLANSRNPRLRAAAAANSYTPGYLQIKLYRDERSIVRENFIGLHRCGNKFFEAATKEGDRDLKCQLAEMSGRTKEQLVALAKDPDVHVRRAVSSRLKLGRFQHYTATNIILVDLLSKDRDQSIRKAMVTDHRLSRNRLNEMAHDKNATVRREVAKHYNTGTIGLTLLLKDKVFRVRFQAALNVLRKCWSWGQHNAVLPLMDVKHLGSCLSRIEKLLLIAAKDPNEKIRRLVSSHKWTPAKVLASMIYDSDKTVQKQLSARSEFPRDAMIRLAQQNEGRSLFQFSLTLSGKVLARLAKSRNEFTRAMAARNYRTPIAALRQLASDKSTFVKLKLTQNPKYNK